MICGNGGVNPDYFFNKMGFGEAAVFVSGMEERKRPGWEQTRMLAWFIISALAGGDDDLTPQKLLPLPWDEKQEETEAPTDEQLERLREKAKLFENILNKKDNG